jgi:hypothetical protein
MLIKLFEIQEEILHSNKAENFKKKLLLREVVINTDFIVTMRHDVVLEKYFNENPNMNDGLEKDQKFTRVSMNKGSVSNDVIILGSIDNIMKLLEVNNKKVIKG